MSTIKKRKGNNYSIRFVKTVDGISTQEQFALGTKSKRTAELWQRRLDTAVEKGEIDVYSDFDFSTWKENWNKGDISSNKNLRLDQLIDKFLKHSTQQNEKTKKNYKSILNRFNDDVGKTLLASMVTEDDVIEFVFNEDYSISTQNNYLTHLKAFYNWVYSRGLGRNVAKPIQVKTEPDTLKEKILSENELESILEDHEKFIEEQIKNRTINDNDLKQDWFYPLITFAYNTGLRLAEVLNLKWRHVDLDDGIINVVGGKGGKSRSVIILKDLKPILEKWKDQVSSEPDRFVFESARSRNDKSIRMTNDHVSKTFKRHCRSVSLSESINFHSLRHSYATNRLKDGFDLHMVQKMMGHSNSKTTERYVHLFPVDLKERASKLGLI